jgi:hypothetical protein
MLFALIAACFFGSIIVYNLFPYEDFICGLLIITTVSIFFSATIIGVNFITADANKSEIKQRYSAIQYKMSKDPLHFIDDAQEWNEELARYRALEKNLWIGMYYEPNIYEEVELINYE